MSSNWYLARTRPTCEHLAASALERSGFSLFFPIIKKPRKTEGYYETPLFPGYLFVAPNDDQDGLPPIHRITGLAGWVEFDGEVPSVPDSIVEELRVRLENMNDTGGYWNRYWPGDKVRVVAGKMETLAEVLEEPKSPHSRVRVLLDFMGRLVPSRVPWSDIQPLPDDFADRPGERRPRRTRGRGRWIEGFGPRTATGPSP